MKVHRLLDLSIIVTIVLAIIFIVCNLDFQVILMAFLHNEIAQRILFKFFTWFFIALFILIKSR